MVWVGEADIATRGLVLRMATPHSRGMRPEMPASRAAAHTGEARSSVGAGIQERAEHHLGDQRRGPNGAEVQHCGCARTTLKQLWESRQADWAAIVAALHRGAAVTRADAGQVKETAWVSGGDQVEVEPWCAALPPQKGLVALPLPVLLKLKACF